MAKIHKIFQSKQWRGFSQTFPTSGMMQNGQLLPLEASVPPINGNGSSSSPTLPTPRASDPGSEFSRSGEGFRPQLGEVVRLLPTIQARDAHGSNKSREGGMNLPDAVFLLPTPGAADATGGGVHPDTRGGHHCQLIDEVVCEGEARWGRYAAAIARWERLTRPAPPATEPTRHGNKRLAAAFGEWMMGWPKGWVTDLINPTTKRDPDLISRAAGLKIIGNGVVPQQAAAALTMLLEGAENERRDSRVG